MTFPVNVNAQTLSAEMIAKAGPKQVRAMATISMPKDSELQISVATRYGLVLDCSGSTGNQIGESVINTVMRKATCSIVDLMGDQDEVVVVQFDDNCTELDVLSEPVLCDIDGKATAQMALNSIEPRGGTTFSTGLEMVQKYFPAPAGKNGVVIFVSDGENYYSDHEPAKQLCDQLRASGVMVYTACINNGAVGNAGETLLSAMAQDKYFKSATTPEEVVEYFKTVLKASQKAAITDAVLEFRPIKAVGAVSAIEFVEKNGTDVYVAGSVVSTDGRLTASVKVDQVGPGDRIAVHISFSVTTKEFAPGFTKEARSFGRIRLMGSCASLGLQNVELASCDMEVMFSANPARVQNKNVQRVIGIADGARAKFQVANTIDPNQQQQILKDAAAKVKGTMALTGDDPTLAAVLAGLGDLSQTSSPEDMANKARKGTQVLRADDADAALAGL